MFVHLFTFALMGDSALSVSGTGDSIPKLIMFTILVVMLKLSTCATCASNDHVKLNSK